MRIEFNDAGFAELLTSAAVEALVEEQAQKLCAAANRVPSTTSPPASEPYYEVQDASDGQRARRRVRATSQRAVRHDTKTQALLRSLGDA